MYNIEILNSSVIIKDYIPGSNEKLENTFSIYDKLYHRYYPKAMYFDGKDLHLPGGTNMFYVTGDFGDNIINNRNHNFTDYKILKNIKLKFAPRDEIQKKAIRFGIGEGEYTNNRHSTQLSINLSTGKGKTYVSIAIFAYFSVRTMMITSSLDWINQWKERILEYTNLNESEIYIISGRTSIAKLLNGIRNIEGIKFFLCSHSTIKSYADKYGWEKVSELFDKLKIGIKIYDEAHLFFDSMCMLDFYTNVWKTYYLTATPNRSDRKEDFIYQVSFHNVPKISLFDEENDPHTHYIALLYNSHPEAFDVSSCKSQYGFSINKYCNYLITKPNYYNMLVILMDIIKKKVSRFGKVLIYIGTNHAISRTACWLRYYYPQYSYGIFTSTTPKELKQQQLEAKIILSTVKSAGAAVDIYGLEMTIVLNEPFKSQVSAKQTLGRTRSDNTFYIDIVDTGFNAIQAFHRSKKSLFKKYAKSYTETIINDYEISNQLNRIKEEEIMNYRLMQNSLNDQTKKQVVTIVPKDKR